ncbi:hypothetical protein HWV62_22493 [Athelia sp. TMB]|nr:hypothetical protein HWV62_22493 [Athelia sp. TMB]
MSMPHANCHRLIMQAFIEDVSALTSGASTDSVRRQSNQIENHLRELYARDRNHPYLSDPYVGLIDLYSAPLCTRSVHAREFDPLDFDGLSSSYVLPLSANERRKSGELAVAASFPDFLETWGFFTENLLKDIEWSNVIAAGGSVANCITPLPDQARGSPRKMRDFLHHDAYPTADVDLFLYGLTACEAEKKIIAIANAIQNTAAVKTICVRTKHAVSIIAEIILSFDVDSTCVAFDGKRVLVTPRACIAYMTQCNTVDISRRSPSYEMRLFKYATRGFEICVPTLRRRDVSPKIYQLPLALTSGLARLLCLEKRYRDDAVSVEGKPPTNRYEDRAPMHDEDRLPTNDYDVSHIKIPYNPQWNANRVKKLVDRVNLMLNRDIKFFHSSDRDAEKYTHRT